MVVVDVLDIPAPQPVIVQKVRIPLALNPRRARAVQVAQLVRKIDAPAL